MHIYVLRNRVNRKVYVGKTERTLAERWQEHCEAARYAHSPLYRAMRKYGVSAFVPMLVDSAKSRAELDMRERFWIWALRATSRGYNLTSGGTGGTLTGEGLVNYKEGIQKRSSNPEWHEKLSVCAIKRGTAHMATPEARNTKGLSLKGRVFSNETRARMSEAAKNRARRNPEALAAARAARQPEDRDVRGRFIARAAQEVNHQ